MRLTPKILKQVISEAIRDLRYDSAVGAVGSYINAKWIWPVPGDTNNPVYNEWDRLEKSMNIPTWNKNNKTDTTAQIAKTYQMVDAAVIPEKGQPGEHILTQKAKDELLSVLTALFNKND